MNIFQSIRKRLEGKYSRIIRGLLSIQADCSARYGPDYRLVRLIGEELNYLRWRRWLGNDALKFLGIRKPHLPYGLPGIAAQIDGYDLEKDVRIEENGVRVGDILLPKPHEGADTATFEIEMNDFVLPYFLRRRLKDFDEKHERLYDLLESLYCVEGPYELGNDVALCPGDVVVDCGANMGLFSAIAAQNGCRVFAFEPIPIVIDNYLSVTAANYPTVTICRYALWDEKKELLFKVSPQNIGSSTAIAEKSLERHIDVRVEATTLDDFVERNNVENIDFIKADIEGAERNMLRGAKNVLKRFAPKLAICKYHLPDDPQVIRDIILDANSAYRIVEKYTKLFAYVPKPDGGERSA